MNRRWWKSQTRHVADGSVRGRRPQPSRTGREGFPASRPAWGSACDAGAVPVADLAAYRFTGSTVARAAASPRTQTAPPMPVIVQGIPPAAADDAGAVASAASRGPQPQGSPATTNQGYCPVGRRALRQDGTVADAPERAGPRGPGRDLGWDQHRPAARPAQIAGRLVAVSSIVEIPGRGPRGAERDPGAVRVRRYSPADVR